jgi:sialidase-1
MRILVACFFGLVGLWLPLAEAANEAPAVRPPHASRPFISGTEGYHTLRIPAVVVTGKGTVLAFCEGRKTSASDTGDIDMVARRSLDGGLTWQPLQRIWDDGPNTCGNPCPVVDRATGVVWLLLTHNLGEDEEGGLGRRTSKGTRTVWVTKSGDDGATWTKPIEITSTTKRPDWGWYATGPGVGIQLRTPPHAGRLVIPCNYSVQPDPAHPERFEYGDHVITSDDHGATWRLGGVVPSLKIDEPQAAELADGSILMNCRSHLGLGCRAASVSRDGGQTWGTLRHERALIEPNCQGSLLRYDDAAGGRPRLLFSNPASTSQRQRLTVRVSDDGGATWPVARLIDGGPCAYSCLTVLADGTIACLYECGRKDPYEGITFAWFSMDWLRGGATRP